MKSSYDLTELFLLRSETALRLSKLLVPGSLHDLPEQSLEILHRGGLGVAGGAGVGGGGLGQELQVLKLHGLQLGGDAHIHG